jgi:glycosyltransferase involved in cell wall biosynthesis
MLHPRRTMSLPLTVLIATHNRLAILERTLAALGRQTTLDFSVVVVDDGSTDGTWEWLLARAAQGGPPRLRAARQDHRGQGCARNLGLHEVDGGLVGFLGDDILVRPAWVAEHLAAHTDATEPCGVVGFTDWCRSEVRVTPALEMANREGHQFGYGHMTAGAEVPFTCFYTSNLTVPRAALGDNPFDGSFAAYGWEDVELGYRLYRQGLRLYYHPAAAAEHLHPMDLASLFERQRTVGRGVHSLLRLHPELAGSPHLSPARPPGWFPVGRRLVPMLLPVLTAVDNLGIPLTVRVLHRVLMVGFHLGQEEARPST